MLAYVWYSDSIRPNRPIRTHDAPVGDKHRIAIFGCVPGGVWRFARLLVSKELTWARYRSSVSITDRRWSTRLYISVPYKRRTEGERLAPVAKPLIFPHRLARPKT